MIGEYYIAAPCFRCDTPSEHDKDINAQPQSGDGLGAGDSHLVLNVLPDDLADVAFGNLRTEVKWDTMYHRGGSFTVLTTIAGRLPLDRW